MLISVACRSKTTRALAGAPRCGKSSRDKGLIQGRSPRYRPAYETSRYMTKPWSRMRQEDREAVPADLRQVQLSRAEYWSSLACDVMRDTTGILAVESVDLRGSNGLDRRDILGQTLDGETGKHEDIGQYDM